MITGSLIMVEKMSICMEIYILNMLKKVLQLH